MRNLEFAEALLLLVSEPERAAPIIGDLAELEPDSDFVRFWARFSQIWLHQFGCTVVAAPLELAGAVAKGIGIGALATAAIFLAFGTLETMIRAGASDGGEWALTWAAGSSVFVVPYVVGLWVAWNAPKRELAAGFVTGIVLVGLVWGVGLLLSWHLSACARALFFVGGFWFLYTLVRTACRVRRERRVSPSVRL